MQSFTNICIFYKLQVVSNNWSNQRNRLSQHLSRSNWRIVEALQLAKQLVHLHDNLKSNQLKERRKFSDSSHKQKTLHHILYNGTIWSPFNYLPASSKNSCYSQKLQNVHQNHYIHAKNKTAIETPYGKTYYIAIIHHILKR